MAFLKVLEVQYLSYGMISCRIIMTTIPILYIRACIIRSTKYKIHVFLHYQFCCDVDLRNYLYVQQCTEFTAVPTPFSSKQEPYLQQQSMHIHITSTAVYTGWHLSCDCTTLQYSRIILIMHSTFEYLYLHLYWKFFCAGAGGWELLSY